MNGSFKFAIITNEYQDSIKIALELKQKLQDRNAKENKLNPDVIFIVGGDGTFLKAVNRYNEQLSHVKFVAFKQGKLGFYHHFLISDFDQVLDALVARSQSLLTVQELDLLEIEANNKTCYAINEMRLVNFSQTLVCDVYVNQQLLEVFCGTGIIIATKTGSTGLMKSTGGAIILANTKLMEYQELFPVHNNVYRSICAPLIFDDKQVLTFKLRPNLKEKLNNSHLVIDTFNFHDKLVKEIKVKISSQTLKIFTFKVDQDFLIKKLNNAFIQY